MKRTAFLCAGLALIGATAFAGDGNIRRSARPVPGQYIVVLETGADVADVAGSVHGVRGARVAHRFERGVKGFAFESSDADAKALARDPRVRFVEEDSIVTAAATVPWGLDRIDQHALPLDVSYTAGGTGAGVTVYVVDTGILAEHTDFGGRVAAGFNALADNAGTTDCNGHGTHVAGIIGGASFGVAKSVKLVPVRVLDCTGQGTVSSVLAGLDWVLQDHAQSGTPAVVNLSFGGYASSVVDSEVTQVLNAGMTTVVAAGNNNEDACNGSPARVPGALTVGATTDGDQRASFSNWGGCVDLFAPGAGILSDWYTSPTAAAVASGTSAAAPFVSGVAALCLEKYPTASVSSVEQTILSQATPNLLSDVNGSPNLLLFSLLGAAALPQDGTQLVSDPGFDFGTLFWSSDVCSVVNTGGCPPTDVMDMAGQSMPGHSGKSHAAIGGPAKSSYLTSEGMTIPTNMSAGKLEFYLWIVTKDKKASSDDTITVTLLDDAGKVLKTLGTYSNLDACPDYLLRSITFSKATDPQLFGKPVHIGFRVNQDNGPPTWFLLDDVALYVK